MPHDKTVDELNLENRVVNRRDMMLGGTMFAAAVGSSGVTRVAQAQTAAPAPASGKPNVVFILADNVGYGDLGPYGGGELRGAPTPRIDQLAREGLRLTQFLVEPACTPSRAALLTGRYSIREGLSLILVPGGPNTLSARSVTMGELFKSAGYATAIFGKWHLGIDPQSLPTAHGFDEFYGIPPDMTWDSATYVDKIELTHSIIRAARRAAGERAANRRSDGRRRACAMSSLSPRRYSAEIDNELVEKSIDFMRRQNAAGQPFFLYLPFSMGHIPNLPSSEFKGKSRIGNYGDKLMEGDYHVGQILDALKQLGVDDNTLLVFASDNGPSGEAFREYGNEGTPDMGSPGPFRGELGEATEGSIRTFCFMRWPGQRQAEHDFLCDVLDHGLLSNLRQHYRGQGAQTTVQSTASIRPTCYSEKVRPGNATAY